MPVKGLKNATLASNAYQSKERIAVLNRTDLSVNREYLVTIFVAVLLACS